MSFPTQTNSSWTPERVAILRELWPKKSASVIAAQLGGLTRSAVIGKANRLNLEVKERSGGVRKLRQREQKREARKVVLFAINNPPLEQRKTIFELKIDSCRWIVGEPSSPDHFYCGRTAEEEKPYCPGHCELAYMEARR